MAKFIYQGLQGQHRRNGEIDAVDRRAALNSLRGMGIVPVKVVEADGSSATLPAQTGEPRRAGFSLGKSIKGKDITGLTRQLGTLTNAGFPLARALTFVARQAENGQLHDLITSIDNEVRGGATLSEALSHHPREFDTLYINMIRAGEAGGILALLLDRLASMGCGLKIMF